MLVDNEPGVLHRVVGLFAARGYNIESLTVAETDREAHTSRITIVTRGTPQVLAQIEAQLEKMVSTRHVQDVTRDPNGVERELALVKVRGVGAERVEALRLADIFRAQVIDTTTAELHLRDHRRARQDRQVRRPDAAAGPGRGVAHRRAVDRARRRESLREPLVPHRGRGPRRGGGQAATKASPGQPPTPASPVLPQAEDSAAAWACAAAGAAT